MAAVLTPALDCKQGPEICQVLAQGKGSLHGIDSSPAMIKAAQKAHEDAGIKCASFEGELELPPLSRLASGGDGWPSHCPEIRRTVEGMLFDFH